jgi:hypothetical protein
MRNDSESLAELERELMRLCPRPISPRLLAALTHDFGVGEPKSTRAKAGIVARPAWLAWPAAAAFAATVAWFAALPQGHAPEKTGLVKPNQNQPVYKPVATRSLLVASDVGRLVALPEGGEVRAFRDIYVDTIIWRDTAGNASLRWSLPREEIRVVPVEVY